MIEGILIYTPIFRQYAMAFGESRLYKIVVSFGQYLQKNSMFLRTSVPLSKVFKSYSAIFYQFQILIAIDSNSNCGENEYHKDNSHDNYTAILTLLQSSA